jgi:hypothetical protein
MIILIIGGSGTISRESPLKVSVHSIIEKYITKNTPGIAAPIASLFIGNPAFRFRRKLFDSVVKITQHLNNPVHCPRGLCVFAKSLGAYKFYRNYDLYKFLLPLFDAVSIVTVDPYAPFFLCGKNHPLSVPRSMSHYTQRTGSISIFNLYQWNAYPRGARVLGASNIPVDANHRTIVNHKQSMLLYEKTLLWTNHQKYQKNTNG